MVSVAELKKQKSTDIPLSFSNEGTYVTSTLLQLVFHKDRI